MLGGAVMNAYEILGVAPSASLLECQRAYKRLCRVHHPDVGGSADKFRAVQEAWNAIQKGNGLVTVGASVKQVVAPVLRHVSLFRFARQ